MLPNLVETLILCESVTWLIWVRHDSHMGDMTHLWSCTVWRMLGWARSTLRVCDMTHSCATWFSHMKYKLTWLIFVWRDSFIGMLACLAGPVLLCVSETSIICITYLYVTQLWVWRDAVMRKLARLAEPVLLCVSVTWLICMTHSYLTNLLVWRHSFVWLVHKWLICVWRDSFMRFYGVWRDSCMYDTTHSREAWLMHVCRDSFIRVMLLICV